MVSICLTRQVSIGWQTALCVLVFSLFSAQGNARAIVVKFCAPQHDVYPFFVHTNDRLTGMNPDMLAQVFNPKDLPQATLEYVKRPWKRCVSDLENGAADMMIGGYDPDRENVAYPSSLGFDLNTSAISTADICFFSVPGDQMKRARKGLTGESSFIVGIEAGFSRRHHQDIDPQWVELFNPIEKYRMLEKGRVDAIVQVCAMDGKYPIASEAARAGFSHFEALFPPYLSNPAYVVFSETFAASHRDLATLIIRLSLKVDKQRVYPRYQTSSILN